VHLLAFCFIHLLTPDRISFDVLQYADLTCRQQCSSKDPEFDSSGAGVLTERSLSSSALGEDAQARRCPDLGGKAKKPRIR